MDTLTGKFLVASPRLRDPNFSQTVVFIIQHQEEGALGVILNRPSEKSVQDVWKVVGKPTCDSEQRVYLGGPVPGPLLAIHTLSSRADQEVLPGLFVTAQESEFHQLVDQTMEDCRVYSGHAGWGGGQRQLDAEMEAGGWLTTGATADDIFSDSDTLWKRMTSRIGLGILAPEIHPDQVPKDPGVN